MTEAQEMRELLREILDVQRVHFQLYQRNSERALEIQQRSVEQQTRAVRLQRRALMTLAAAGAMLIGLVILSVNR